jgi:hypothetical protein
MLPSHAIAGFAGGGGFVGDIVGDVCGTWLIFLKRG